MNATTSRGKVPAKPILQIWAGYTLAGWLRLLVRNRFAVERGSRAVALRNTIGCALNSVLGLTQQVCHGACIARTPLAESPMFVLGHWRSGTTFLHHLLSQDPRFTYPTSYECFMPHHFLLSEDFVKRRVPMNTQRDIDQVEWSWDTPEEDEWALALLGQPSPYLTIAFPNRPVQGSDFLDLEDVPPPHRTAWKQTLLHFVQAVVCRRPGRPLLKSPTHTARIKVLLELFPDARFVHIVRNPYQVIPSTLRTFQKIYLAFGLQQPPFPGLEDLVFYLYRRVFRRLEEGRRLVAAGHFHELRYEELAQDPVAEVAALYEHLALGDFDAMSPRLRGYLARVGDYRATRHDLSPALEARITEECAEVIQRYDYTPAVPLASAAEV